MRHNRYSSWLTVIDEINVNITNLNLSQRIVNLATAQYGWNGGSNKKLRAIINIAPGVVISSTNPVLPALTIPTSVFRSYDLIILNNRGTIAGASGTSGLAGFGNTNGSDGGTGGTAIQASRSFFLNNFGNIYGGGGGGGGGGGNVYKTYRERINNCAQFNGCGATTDRCYISGSTTCNNNLPTWYNPGPYCPTSGSININSPCGSSRLFQENAGSCVVNWNNNDGSNCTITYNYATCLTDEVRCFDRSGGNGGLGRGYGAGGAINNIAGTASVQTGTGNGGSGGDWGLDGLPGDPATAPSLGTPTTDILQTPSNGGNGGLAGFWINGIAFLNLRASNLELGRTA